MRLIVLALLCLTALPLAGQDLRLPAVIGEHMVLQREMPVPIWGWAQPGVTVTVRFMGQSHEAVADDAGAWRVDLDALQASAEPAELTVSAKGKTLTVGDVLVGEVWLCSGQSNMEWTINRSANAAAEAANADWPQIRHLKTPRATASTPQDDANTNWTVCSPQTASEYTAVGYYFGRRLHQELGVPIGLLNCSWGGTRIEPWTPVEGFAAVEEVQDIYLDIVRRLPGSPAYRAMAAAHLDATEAWLAAGRRAIEAGEALPQAPAGFEPAPPFTGRQDPTTLYNAMMAPVVPFAIRGSIWYQGESNRFDGMAYFHKTQALLAGWRQAWDMPELPYYFVQIAPFQYGEDDPHILPRLWEAQQRVETDIPFTNMVVISDIGNLTNIHPTNKQDVGLRLANRALTHEYDRDMGEVTGPRFQSFDTTGQTVKVSFDHEGDGLASRDDKPLTGFEVAGPGQPWHPVTARVISADTVELTGQGVENATAVRFAWHKLATPNLMNSVGLPAAPFRAGAEPDASNLLNNVPQAKDYKLVYALDLNKLGTEITYDQDHAADIAPGYDRVAYYLEMGNAAGQTQWVFVSMDPFTNDPTKLGIPTAASGASFQQAVGNLTVISNVPGLPNAQGLAGNLEFWPNNYAKPNSANVPGASNDAYDTGDQPSGPIDGYGSMQVHLRQPAATVFALNHWREGGNADLGIGTNTAGGERDYTFTKSAAQWTLKELRVLVRPQP